PGQGCRPDHGEGERAEVRGAGTLQTAPGPRGVGAHRARRQPDAPARLEGPDLHRRGEGHRMKNLWIAIAVLSAVLCGYLGYKIANRKPVYASVVGERPKA